MESNIKPWFLTILRIVKQALHTIWAIVIKCLKGVGCFLKKRWKIIVSVIAVIAAIIAGVAWFDYYKQVTLPLKQQRKAVDLVESKLNSDDSVSRAKYSYEILQKKHSENFEEFIYYEDLSFGVIQDRFNSLKQEAFNFIRKEAFGGNAMCQHYLGNLYHFKEDYVENDDSKAAYWWNEAALQDYVKSFNSIGMCYKDGAGVNKDLRLAVEWFKKGAESGEKYAQYNYGKLFLEGVKIQIGTHKQLKPGYSPGLYTKYDLYAWEDIPDYEVLIAKDVDQAKFWWKKAAEQGHLGALDALQKIYN